MASIVTGTARPDDLSTLILKGSTMSSERDGGSCSGGDEDDLDVDGVHSPTDASEDSVEVKVTAISPRNKNKRKCAEPRKVANDFPSGPLKKRIRHDAVTSETNGDISKSPFRPWSLPARPNPTQNTPSPPPPQTYHPVYGYHPVESVKQQEEPLSLVKSIKTEQGTEIDQREMNNEVPQDQQILDRLAGTVTRLNIPNGRLHSEEFRKAERCPVDVRRLKQEKLLENDYDSMRIQPNLLSINMEGHSLTDPVMKQALSRIQTDDYSARVPPHPAIQQQSPDHVLRYKVDPISPTSQSSMARSSSSMSIAGDHKKKQSVAQQQKEQRNYKNMTRERRIEANARERTRVHTISAAFDTLRRAIPAYSHNQKLSKLSVLRIACSYILTLSRVAGSDYSQDQSEPSISSCVDLVTRTIQTEGKLRKKKDE